MVWCHLIYSMVGSCGILVYMLVCLWPVLAILLRQMKLRESLDVHVQDGAVPRLAARDPQICVSLACHR